MDANVTVDTVWRFSLAEAIKCKYKLFVCVQYEKWCLAPQALAVQALVSKWARRSKKKLAATGNIALTTATSKKWDSVCYSSSELYYHAVPVFYVQTYALTYQLNCYLSKKEVGSDKGLHSGTKPL